MSYIVLVLPGSVGSSTTTTTSPTSVTITAVPTHAQTIPYTIVYIPAGASIDNSVANFNPQNITVMIGVNNTVVWKNEDTHNQAILGPSGLFNSGNITQGHSWNYTFSSTGTYPYTDPNYEWLNGTITVVSGS
jgi:plastocyanin